VQRAPSARWSRCAHGKSAATPSSCVRGTHASAFGERVRRHYSGAHAALRHTLRRCACGVAARGRTAACSICALFPCPACAPRRPSWLRSATEPLACGAPPHDGSGTRAARSAQPAGQAHECEGAVDAHARVGAEKLAAGAWTGAAGECWARSNPRRRGSVPRGETVWRKTRARVHERGRTCCQKRSTTSACDSAHRLFVACLIMTPAGAPAGRASCSSLPLVRNAHVVDAQQHLRVAARLLRAREAHATRQRAICN
jgi:hypothetical protein